MESLYPGPEVSTLSVRHHYGYKVALSYHVSFAVLIWPKTDIANPFQRSVDSELVPVRLPEGALPSGHPLPLFSLDLLVPLRLLGRYRPIGLLRLETKGGEIFVGWYVAQQVEDRGV